MEKNGTTLTCVRALLAFKSEIFGWEKFTRKQQKRVSVERFFLSVERRPPFFFFFWEFSTTEAKHFFVNYVFTSQKEKGQKKGVPILFYKEKLACK